MHWLDWCGILEGLQWQRIGSFLVFFKTWVKHFFIQYLLEIVWLPSVGFFSRRTFGLLFDWLYPAHMPLLLKAVSHWTDVPEVRCNMYKFLLLCSVHPLLFPFICHWMDVSSYIHSEKLWELADCYLYIMAWPVGCIWIHLWSILLLLTSRWIGIIVVNFILVLVPFWR